MKKADRESHFLLRPAAPLHVNRLVIAVLGLLVLSALSVLAAAWAMPPEYSWRSHSISESAAQGQLHGWIARLAFLSFGLGVLLLSIALRGLWPRITYWCGLLFAGSMFSVAAFSHAPWQSGLEGDAFENWLHSLFASGMGVVFVLGVVARFVHRGSDAVYGRGLDVVAVLLATVLPLILAAASDIGGMLQRAMFFVGYIWFGREALLGLRGVKEHAA